MNVSDSQKSITQNLQCRERQMKKSYTSLLNNYFEDQSITSVFPQKPIKHDMGILL